MESYCGWMEIEYTAVWNGIVVGGIFYIQQYGMVFWLEGDFMYSGMECYCVCRVIVFYYYYYYYYYYYLRHAPLLQ